MFFQRPCAVVTVTMITNPRVHYLSLSCCFFCLGKVAFGEVRGKNDALANSFHISSYPSLVFFCGGDAGVSFPYEVRHACVRRIVCANGTVAGEGDIVNGILLTSGVMLVVYRVR